MRRRNLLFVALLAGLFPGSHFSGGLPAPPTLPSIRGVTLDSRNPPADSVLDALSDLGANHIAVIPYAFMPDANGTDLQFRSDHRWYSESDSGVTDLSTRLASRDMLLVLKPQLWVGRAAFTGDIGFASDEEWRSWEARYRAYILHHADLAERTGAAIFVVGTELLRSSTERPLFWRQLIRAVRTRYSGRLTYAANWYREVDEITFWDDLDLIGVQGYYPLHEDDSPDIEALTEAWEPYRAKLETLHRRFSRPVLFTELGYRSISYAAAEPWRWPSRGESASHPPALLLQARLYEAFFQAVWQEPWLAGMIVWKWHAETGRRSRSLDFTPQNKPAQDVLAQWYGRR